MQTRVAVLSALLAVASPASASRAGVIVVDPPFAVGFSVLEAALEDAVDGDILPIRPSDYVTFHEQVYELEGKSLTLIADGGRVEIPGLIVSDTAADQPVVLRGLHFTRTDYDGPVGIVASLSVRDCADAVWIEDCAIEGRDAVFTFTQILPGRGLHVSQSARVTVTSCTIVGGAGQDEPGGGSGQGSQGILAIGAYFTLLDSQVAGGDDGVGTTAFALAGPGIVGNGASNAWLRDSTVTPGAAQDGDPPAPAITVPPANVYTYPAAARSLSVGSPLREGASDSLEFEGVQGDKVWLLASLAPDFVPLVGKQGVLCLSTPPFIVVLSAQITSPTGHLTLPFAMPTLPGGLDGLAIHLQGMSFGVGGPTLGSPTCLVWIDDAF